jgi:hypothetical protein
MAFEGLLDICFPEGAVWTCAYTEDEIEAMIAVPETALVMARAEALAWSTLAALTGYRLSLCPVKIRPCAKGCSSMTWYTASVTSASFAGAPSGGTFSPYVANGSWYNACGCKTDDCSCTALCEVLLPGGVGGIESVMLDGAVIPPSAYRVDNGNRLLRTDGECWPLCQDMTADEDEAGSFVVTYYPGVAPNDLFRYAAGVMAVEYFNACNGKNCRLPSGVTSITRQGMSMEVSAGTFPSGMTGIPEVDAVIRIYNPHMLASRSRVLSPDSRRGRIQTGG